MRMHPRPEEIKPEFMRVWKSSFEKLIESQWGALYASLLSGQSFRMNQIIDDYYKHIEQGCGYHINCLILDRPDLYQVRDVYRYLARLFLYQAQNDEVDTTDPVHYFESAFPSLSRTGSCVASQGSGDSTYHMRHLSDPHRGHRPCIDILDIVPKFWQFLGCVYTGDQNHPWKSEVPHYRGIPVLMCQTCECTPLGYDQTHLLGPGHSDPISVSIACQRHIVSMMTGRISQFHPL